MVGLDTNVLLRAATSDDPVNTPVARRIIAGLTADNPGVINTVVLAEFAWSLRTGYGYERAEILNSIEALMRSPSFVVRDREAVNAALARCGSEPLAFSDALIGELNVEAGCSATLTFDGEAARSGLFRPAQQD